MSQTTHSGDSIADEQQTRARVFAALGDQTRLSLVVKLCGGESWPIARLAQGTKMTRQAVTKHLNVLENAGIVRSVRIGRESLFKFDPEPVDEVREYLSAVSEQWDQALLRLKEFVEAP